MNRRERRQKARIKRAEQKKLNKMRIPAIAGADNYNAAIGQFRGLKCLVDVQADPVPSHKGIFRNSHPDPRWFRNPAKLVTAENIKQKMMQFEKRYNATVEIPGKPLGIIEDE